MPKNTRSPAALLRADGSTVSDGDVLPTSFAGHQARLVGGVPDADGLVTVQETFRVRPEEVGLTYRPGSVTMVLTDDEAAVLLKLYESQALTPPLPPDFLQAPQSELPVPTPLPKLPSSELPEEPLLPGLK
jgi:hypothetical protein